MAEKPDKVAHLSVLRSAAHSLSSALTQSEVTEILLQQVVTNLGARGALLRLVGRDEDELLPAGSLGLSDEYMKKGPVELSRSLVDQRVLDGEVVVIGDVTREEGFQYREEALAEGLRGLVAVPLTVRVRVIGILRVYVDDVERLGPEDILLITSVADLGALALEKVWLHQSLYRIAESLSSSLELQPMLQRVLKSVVGEMGLRAASIRLFDSRRKTLHLVAAYGLSQDYLDKGSVRVSKSQVDKRVLNGEVVVIYDVAHDPGYEYPEEAAREGIRSVLVVPLKVKDNLLGVMRAYSGTPRRFGPVAISFLTSSADLVALAIENAELYAALEARYEDLKLDVADWYRYLALG